MCRRVLLRPYKYNPITTDIKSTHLSDGYFFWNKLYKHILKGVLQFRQSDTAAVLLLTLTEHVTINDPYYLFVFTHVLTKEKVRFVKSESQDESTHPDRYNKFTIDATVIFLNAPVGEYHYEVYENTTNGIDETAAVSLLETGKLMVLRSTDFRFTKYNDQVTFKAYNG